MAPSTFDTLAAARELEAKGIDADKAKSIVNAIRQSAGDHVTADRLDAGVTDLRTHTDTGFSELRAHVDTGFSELLARIDTGLANQSAVFYRALWLQGAAIIGVLAGLHTFAGG